MPKVNVPGVGVVNFPDGTTPEQMKTAIDAMPASRRWAAGMEASSNPIASQVGEATGAVMDKGWSEALPVVGGMIGSLVGGGKGTLGGSAAAAAGGGLGELGRQAVQGQPSWTNVLKAAAIQGGGEALGRTAQGGLRRGATKLYTANLKPSKSLSAEYPGAVRQLIDDAVMITRGGQGRNDRLINESVNAARAAASKADASGVAPITGAELNPAFNAMRRTLDRRMRGGTDTTAAEGALDARVDRLRAQPPATVVEGVTYKREQQKLADAAKRAAERGVQTMSTEDELNAASARGWRTATEARAPELPGINALTQRRLGGSEMLTDAMQRESKNIPIGVRDLIGMAGAGSLGWATGNVPLAIGGYGLTRAMATPWSGSAMAIGADRAGLVPIAQVIRAMVLANMAREKVGGSDGR